MEVTRIASAESYAAAKHLDVKAVRLQGFEASDIEAFWVGLSSYPPGGSAERGARGTEKVYVVLEGELAVITDEGEVVARPRSTRASLRGARRAPSRTARTTSAKMLVLTEYPKVDK